VRPPQSVAAEASWERLCVCAHGAPVHCVYGLRERCISGTSRDVSKRRGPDQRERAARGHAANPEIFLNYFLIE
jgi:hypothetical protein